MLIFFSEPTQFGGSMSNQISRDLNKFTLALTEGKRVDCNRKGEWYCEGVLMRSIRWLFSREDARVVKVAAAFNDTLDILEKTPVKFYDYSSENTQQKTFELHLKAADAVKKELEKHTSAASKKALYQLNLRVVSLKYRIEKENGGISKCSNADELLFNEVKKLAEEWKQSYELYFDKTLCEEEVKKIEDICHYPEFAQIIKIDKGLRELFFKWALRDNCEVDAFVQFPATSNRLKTAFIAGRIGRFAKQINTIKIKNLKTGNYEIPSNVNTCPFQKDYVLPFEVLDGDKLKVKDISVLNDEQVINVKNNYTTTVKKVIESFANRNTEPGNFEILGTRHLDDGECLGPRFVNYNSYEYGAFNPQTNDFDRPDLSGEKKEWWKQIAPLDTLTLEDVKRMYGLDSIEEGRWVVVIKSAREDAGLDIDKSHGYLDVLIPDGKGRFELYSIGKYPAKWPESFLERALFITNTLKSKIQCPDENYYMAQRQQAMAPNIINAEDGMELMDNIRQDLVKAQEGNIVFQFPWENCAWWSQNQLEKIFGSEEHGGSVPNHFRTSLLNAKPRLRPLAKIIDFCRQLKGKMQSVAVKVVEFMLCSWRSITVVEDGKKVSKSVATSKHTENIEIFHPSALHERIISGVIKGRITMGHMLLPQKEDITCLTH